MPNWRDRARGAGNAAATRALDDYGFQTRPSYFVLEPRVAFDGAFAASIAQIAHAAVGDGGAGHGDESCAHTETSLLLAALSSDSSGPVTQNNLSPSGLRALNILPPLPAPAASFIISAHALPDTGGGYNVGAWGLWENAGYAGSTAIDIRATVVAADALARGEFGTSGDDLLISAYDGNLTVKWEVFEAGSHQSVAVVSNAHFAITDIDGLGSIVNPAGTPELEAVSPDLHHLTSYTLDNPTNLQTSFSGIALTVQGTTAQSSEPTSLVQLDWSGVSSWQITYTALSPYPNNRNFVHDGNGGFAFTDPQSVTILAVDLDASNLTAPGSSYRTTFIENGSAVAVAGPDTAISENAILGADLDHADVVLKNADLADELRVGGRTASAGIIGGLNYTVTRDGTQITVALSGHASRASYEQALQQIAFYSTADNPPLYSRRIEISVSNAGFETTSNIAVSTIEIAAVNDAPVANADLGSTPEDGALSVSAASGLLANDTDAEGDTLTVTDFSILGVTRSFSAGQTAGLSGAGSLIIHSDGSYSFDPGTAYNGLKSSETATETVSYSISDGNGGTAVATFVITITGANDRPVTVDPANPGTLSNPIAASNPGHVLPVQYSKDSQHIAPFAAAIAIVDPDGDNLVYSATGLPKGLSINAATGVISGTLDHSASVTGPYNVRITATDSSGAATSYTLQWKVSNPAPITHEISASVTAGRSVTIRVVQNDSDPDGDPVHIVTASATAGTIEIGKSGEIRYASRPNFSGKDIITYQISDGEGGFATGRFVVDVTPDDVVPQNEDTGFQLVSERRAFNSDSDEPVEVTGAVLSAAAGHRGLDAVARALSSRHYILNAVNGMAGAYGDSAVRGDSDIEFEVAEPVSYARSGAAIGRLNSEPLKGFVLRTAYSGGNQELIVETLVGRESVYFNFTGIVGGVSDAAVEWTLSMADGRPLPDWIRRDTGRTFIAEVPSHAQPLNLKIIATFPNGSSVERYVMIDLKTGEIRPLKPPRAGHPFPPLFQDMFFKHAGLNGQRNRVFDLIERKA